MNKRTIKKWAILWPVCESKTNDKTVWIVFGFYYEDQEYEHWNDWQEGVGDNWKWSWKCKKQYKTK